MSTGLILRRFFGTLIALLLVVIASGCAHPISLMGNTDALIGAGKVKLDHAVGLAISEEDRKREVITPGGGGDKVSYLPYRDLETGIYIALSESFTKVVRVSGQQDPKVKSEGLRFVITPQINTTSYSPSIVTWPPTIFTIELVCKVTDGEGRLVTELRAMGEGRAEFDEFKSDFSLSAKRAADEALGKLLRSVADNASKLR
ncbi:MAG: hypothetical protein Q7J58_11260 [Hydrogenophaga sp.]|jgi:hypothetical protein|uniref:hypothetical protein n=1 Tax=Hydrogenophaga sp. TaxID=1904254 RepID=UPI002722CEF6|nr:hypothetical protein [Hydrogenophaga sp.]MDO9569945.1 hypothetical protein [Hydrogenophaga sp.]MDP3477429.1 hypothetical protein [Hydrogenophaga sp.]